MRAKPRRIVVRLVDDRIEFHEVRGRIKWTVSVPQAFRFAISGGKLAPGF